MTEPSPAAPLSGIRVLEFAHVAAGPFAGMILADLGADVVKVEPPAGDHMRRWPPFTSLEDGTEFSLNFASVNRGKRSITADLKNDQELERVVKLARTSDVVLENYRPGSLARLGLGFDELTRDHPVGLVYCSLSGYGQVGPYRDRGAFDVVIQAEAGLMSVTGEQGGPPVKCGVPVGDFVAGLYAALSVLAALPQRQTRGSIFIDCPMLSSLLAVSALQTSHYWGTGVPPEALGSAHPRNAPYQSFEASDKPFVLAAGTDALWERTATVAGRADLIEDPRFSSQMRRTANQKALAVELHKSFSTAEAQYWLEALREVGVPCANVNNFEDILTDPHLTALGLLGHIVLPDGTQTPTVNYPARFQGLDLPHQASVPAQGNDNDLESVLEDWLPTDGDAA